MDVGTIEAVLTARLDRDPFDKYDRLVTEANSQAKKGVTTKLDAKADVSQVNRMKRSLHDVDRQNTRTSRSTQGVSRNFAKQAGAALKGAAAAGALFAAYKAGKDAVAVTTDFTKATLAVARATGLSNKASSRWVALTRVRDVDAKAFTMSLTLMSKQIVAANAGTEKSVKAFDALGVSQKALKDGDVNAVLMEVADGLNGMEAGAKRNAVAQTVLGKSYLKLFPLLTGGSKAIREEMKLAAKYGVEVGDKGGKGFKDFAAAQREAQYAQIGLQLQLGEVLIPLITRVRLAVARFIGEWRKPGGKFQEVKDNLKKLGRALSDVATWMKDHAKLVEGMIIAWIGFKVAFAALKLLTTFTAAMGSIKYWAEIGAARGKAFGAALRTGVLLGSVGFVLLIADEINKALTPDAYKDKFYGFMGFFSDLFTFDFGSIWEQFWNGTDGSGMLSKAELFTPLWEGIKEAARDTWRWISNLFSGGQGKLAAIRAPNLQGFYKMGQEVGQWMRKAADRVGDWASRAYSNARAWARNAVNGVTDWLSRLPAKVGGVFTDGVNAIGRLASTAWDKGKNFGRNIVNGIISGIRSIPGAVSNAVRDLLPSALLRKVGSLLGFASGGRVGPTSGGAQLFIAGEGGKDEWVISQEGDRRQNVGWALEALETLTGKPIQGFAAGAKIKGQNYLTGRQESHTKKDWGKIRTSYTTFAKSMAGYSNDTAGDTEEERAWEVSKFSGAEDSKIKSSIDNWGAKNLTGIQGALFNQLKGLLGQYEGLKSAYDSRRKTARTAGWSTRIKALRELPGKISDLTSKRDTIGGVYEQLDALINPVTNDEPPDVPPPSIEQRVQTELASITGARRSAIGAFSSNFSAGGAGYSAGVATSGGSGAGALAASGAQVRIVNNYQAPPEDPHSWSAGLAYELKAAL